MRPNDKGKPPPKADFRSGASFKNEGLHVDYDENLPSFVERYSVALAFLQFIVSAVALAPGSYVVLQDWDGYT